MSYIKAIFEIISAFIAIWKQFKAWKEEQRRQEAERKEEERNKSAEELKNAESEADFDNAQDELVRNKP